MICNWGESPQEPLTGRNQIAKGNCVAATYVREMKPTDEELFNKGLTRNESRSARGVYIGREAGQFLFDLWRNGQIKGKRAAESVEIICKMSEYIKDAQKKNDVQAMAAKLLADGESWDCINVAIQTMAARDMEAKSGKMKQGWLFFGAGFEEELKQRGRFAARSIEFLRQKIKAGEGAQRASENAEEVARQGYTVTRKEGSEEYTLEELVRLMERFKHMASDAELMRDSLEWDGESKLDPIARYLTPERKEDMEEQMRREQEEKEREAQEYLEAHVDSLFGGDGMGSAQMVGGAGAPYVRGTMYDVRFGRERADARGDGEFSASVSARFLGTAQEAKDALKGVQGRVFRNEATGIEAMVTSDTVGKSYAAQMSVRNLMALGYSQEEARQIHYSAFAHVHEIFERADYGEFEKNYAPEKKKGRAGAWHYYGTVDIEGKGSFDVNVTAVVPDRNGGDNRLFSLELTIENPADGRLGYPHTMGPSFNAAGSSGHRLAAYRSNVEKEILKIREAHCLKNKVTEGT